MCLDSVLSLYSWLQAQTITLSEETSKVCFPSTHVHSSIVNVVQYPLCILEKTLREWVTNSLESVSGYPSFVSLVRSCLEFQPTKRIRKELIVDHDFFTSLNQQVRRIPNHHHVQHQDQQWPELLPWETNNGQDQQRPGPGPTMARTRPDHARPTMARTNIPIKYFSPA